MVFIKNSLAIFGLTCLLMGGYLFASIAPVLSEFDPDYMRVYRTFVTKLFQSKDPGVAMMYSVPVQDGIGVDEIKESLKSIATERKLLFSGESPFYKQVEAVTGKPFRHISFMSFCDAKVGKMMADYRNAYTGFMPCRIAVVEDKNGKLWLYSMNLELMIHGGKTLPPQLKKETLRVWNNIKEMMKGASVGDF